MTLPRTFVVEVQRLDGSIDYLRRKGTNADEVAWVVQDEFQDDYVGLCEKRKRFERGTKTFWDRPLFPRNPFRGGQYVYRHKGKKKRGRKNYPVPRGGYTRDPNRRSFSFTEIISFPVKKFLEDWFERINQDDNKVKTESDNLEYSQEGLNGTVEAFGKRWAVEYSASSAVADQLISMGSPPLQCGEFEFTYDFPNQQVQEESNDAVRAEQE